MYSKFKLEIPPEYYWWSSKPCEDLQYRGGGSTARLGGRELTLLCGLNQYTLLQNRDNSGLLGTPLYCSLKLGGGDAPPMLKLGGWPPPLPPLWSPPLQYMCVMCNSGVKGHHMYICRVSILKINLVLSRLLVSKFWLEGLVRF